MRKIILCLLYVFYMFFAVFTFLNGSEILPGACLTLMFLQYFVMELITGMRKDGVL